MLMTVECEEGKAIINRAMAAVLLSDAAASYDGHLDVPTAFLTNLQLVQLTHRRMTNSE